MKIVKFGIANKIVTMTTLLVLFSSVGLGMVFYTKGKQYLVQKDLKTLEKDIALYSTKFKSQVEILKEDVVFLSGTPPIKGIIRARKAGGIDPLDGSTEKIWRQRLSVIFQKFLRNKTDYSQLRYIGVSEDGKEIVRVNREGNNIVNVPDRDLQSKSHRDYFKEAIKFKRGQVYLSRITLNREHGKVSLPHIPSLRGVIPIFDDNGKIFGMIALSLDMGKLLQNPHPGRTRFFVTNQDGDFLFHSNPALNFGFDLGRQYRLQDFYPETKTLFEPLNTDQQLIHLPQSDADTEEVFFFAKMKFDELHPDRFLGLAMTESYKDLIAGTEATSYQFIMTVILVVLTVVVLSLIFARKLVRPMDQIIRAGEDLAHGRDDVQFPTHLGDELGFLANSLEAMDKKVKERTHKLRESEEQNRMITDSVLNALVTINEKGVVQSFNPSAERIFGYKSHEVIGQNVKMLMPEPDRSQHDQYIKNYLEFGRAKILGISREMMGMNKDGTNFSNGTRC